MRSYLSMYMLIWNHACHCVFVEATVAASACRRCCGWHDLERGRPDWRALSFRTRVQAARGALCNGRAMICSSERWQHPGHGVDGLPCLMGDVCLNQLAATVRMAEKLRLQLVDLGGERVADR